MYARFVVYPKIFLSEHLSIGIAILAWCYDSTDNMSNIYRNHLTVN